MPQFAARMLVVALVVLASVPAFAQENKASPGATAAIAAGAGTVGSHYGVGLGIKAAPVFASLSQGKYTWQARKGVVGGVAFGGNRQGRFAVVVEALYARRGAANMGAKAVLNIIELPVLVRINGDASRNARVNVYGLAGHALDLNVRMTQQLRSLTNAVDSNVVVGGGVEISRITIEGRENIGLRQLAPNTPGLKSRSFSVMIGYRIR